MKNGVRLVAFVCLLVMSGTLFLIAQDNEIILTIAPPDVRVDHFKENMFDDFEEAHPGVKVVIAEVDHSLRYPTAARDIEEHLDGASHYATVADVVYVSQYYLSVEATQAGYFLDLAPLVQSDPEFDETAYIPSVWQSAQWDGGLYAIPVSATISVLSYDRNAFDEAGLTYPTEQWTIDAFGHAASELSTWHDNGEVDTPGFMLWSPAPFLRTLLQNSIYTGDTQFGQPNFRRPELVELVENWVALVDEGVISQRFDGSFESTDVPMVLSNLTRTTFSHTINPKWKHVLLPGNTSIMSTDGFAVSAGTDYPELAYELALYLSESEQVFRLFYGDIPARWDQLDNDGTAYGDARGEKQDFVMQAINSAIPPAEMRHLFYLDEALTDIVEQGLDVGATLQEIQLLAEQNAEIALARRNTGALVVSTPIPTPVITADQIELQFGIYTNASPLPYRQEWLRLAREFAAQYPHIGQVQIIADNALPHNYNRDFDCFFASDYEFAYFDREQLLPLDPLMAADPGFDADGILPSVLEQSRVGDQVYGYPLMAHPFSIWIEVDDFAEVNVPQPPTVGWTVDEFLDALMTLQPTMDVGTSAFQLNMGSGEIQILLLTAAFGGLPLDYRTTPATVDFTSTETVAALRQVLDLVKAGYLQHYPLAYFDERYGAFGYAPIYTSRFTWIVSDYAPDTHYIPVNYPQGSLYTPASYTLDMAFIKRSSVDPQACYDWIRFIAGHPDLFNGVPVLESTIDDFFAHSDNMIVSQFYRAFGDTLQADNLVTYPNVWGGPSQPEHFWLNRVFDRYVLEDADLEQELAQAEQLIREYRECVGEEALIHVPPPDERRPIDVYFECAMNIDPNYRGRIFVW